MFRKIALCAGLALALTITSCANATTSTAEESSVGFDASAKSTDAKSGECTEAKAEHCTAEKAAKCSEGSSCCEKKAGETTTNN